MHLEEVSGAVHIAIYDLFKLREYEFFLFQLLCVVILTFEDTFVLKYSKYTSSDLHYE